MFDINFTSQFYLKGEWNFNAQIYANKFLLTERMSQFDQSVAIRSLTKNISNKQLTYYRQVGLIDLFICRNMVFFPLVVTGSFVVRNG